MVNATNKYLQNDNNTIRKTIWMMKKTIMTSKCRVLIWSLYPLEMVHRTVISFYLKLNAFTCIFYIHWWSWIFLILMIVSFDNTTMKQHILFIHNTSSLLLRVSNRNSIYFLLFVTKTTADSYFHSLFCLLILFTRRSLLKRCIGGCTIKNIIKCIWNIFWFGPDWPICIADVNRITFVMQIQQVWYILFYNVIRFHGPSINSSQGTPQVWNFLANGIT